MAMTTREERKIFATRLLLQSLLIELIADSSKGQDPFGFTIVLFDGLSQAANMNIDRAGCDEGFATPDPVQQLIAAEHPIGILDQKTQKLKFLQGQLDIFASGENFVGCEVNLKTAFVVGW